MSFLFFVLLFFVQDTAGSANNSNVYKVIGITSFATELYNYASSFAFCCIVFNAPKEREACELSRDVQTFNIYSASIIRQSVQFSQIMYWLLSFPEDVFNYCSRMNKINTTERGGGGQEIERDR